MEGRISNQGGRAGRRITLTGEVGGWQERVAAELRDLGHTVERVAGTGDVAARVAGTEPELVVCWLTVPEMEGWRVCRLVRGSKDLRLERVPVLVLTETAFGPEAGEVTECLGGRLVTLDEVNRRGLGEILAEMEAGAAGEKGARGESPCRLANDRYHVVAEHSRTVYWEVDATGLYTYVSDVAESVWGYSPKELTGRKHFYDIHPEAGREEFRQAGMKTLAKGAPFRNLKNAIERKDGCVIWVLTSGIAVVGRDGELEGYRGSDTEISEWHRTEEALALERKRLESVIEGTNAGTWEWNIQTGEVTLNERWAEIAGYRLEELEPTTIGTWTGLAHPEDLEESNRLIEAHCEGRSEAYDFECRMRHRSGEWIWVHDRGKVVEWDADGKPLRMAGTHTDIHARRQSQEELRKSRDVAEAATRTKGEFLSMMSHEIRTPLNGIVGMCGLLAETELRPEQAEYARVIGTSAETLMAIVNDVLDFSKMEAGKQEIVREAFDLRQTLEEVVDLVSLRAGEKGLEVALQYAPGLPSGYFGDPGRIRQVALNLVNNGIKFTDAGQVAVEVRVAAGAGEADTVRIAVRDTGIGIAADKMGELFSVFTQLDASSTRRHGGSGLGLAISRRFARLMGGDVTVESQEGRGSAFTLTLPLERNPAEVREGPEGFGGVRVEVMGERELSRGIVAEWCRHWGMEVEEKSGELREGVRLRMEGGNWEATVALPVRPRAVRTALESGLAVGGPPSAEPKQEEPVHADVLVVEDNPVNQRIATALLERIGCRVELATNGREALERVAKHRYDLILMDCQMPGMDGYEATARIRQSPPPMGRIPIVALTASALSGDRERCLSAGMDGYLTKPVRAADLRRTVGYWQAREHWSKADSTSRDGVPIRSGA
jgi:PAS domain S-box-containing protein